MTKKKAMTKTKEIVKNKSIIDKISESNWKNVILFAAVLIFLVILLSPMSFEGLRPKSGDVIGSLGRNHQYQEYEKDGESVLWNKNVFSGMPVYHRKSAEAFSFDKIIHSYLAKVLYLNIWLYLVGFIGMFYLLRFFKLSWWTSAFCALGFILIPHYMSLLSIGHFQKFRPIMYMPLVTFFFVSFINKKNLLWLLGFIFSFTVQIRTHHYQVIFYQVIVLVFLGLFYLINLIREGKISVLLKKILLLIPACILIIGMVAQPLFVTGEYTPYSIRGGLEGGTSSGLDSSYATGWSMHPLAMFNWVMPRFFGGTSQETYEGSAVPQLTGQTIPGYWGHMPSTGTYDYIGIILFFLAFVGVIANWKKSLIKVLCGLFLFALLLSFGRHFQAFYNLFFHYLPAFNKFRVPAMIQLVIFMVTIIFAGFGVESILKGDIKLKKIIIIVTVLLVLSGMVPYLFGGSFQMIKGNDISRYGADTVGLFAAARLDMMQSDGVRLILYALACALVTWLFLTKKIKPALFMIILLGLMLSDQVPYMIKAEGELEKPTELDSHFRKTKRDEKILRDTSYYRVLDLTKSTFTSNDCSYHYNSVGGYSAAKLSIYQDILESNIFHNGLNWNILKMLNTKYIIINDQELPVYFYHLDYDEKYIIKDPDVLGHKYTYKANQSEPAWFAANYQVIADRDKRLDALNDPQFDAYQTAILEENPGIEIAKPNEGSIEVEDASYNYIKYKVSHDTPALFVASEIYYPKGWKCSVDGAEVPINKTDHILRSVFLETPGEQEVIFRFEPATYLRYLSISIISHWIAWLLLLGLSVYYILQKRKHKVS